MKKKISFIIGVILLVIALLFVSYSLQHPELSFPFSQRITFMLYGAYIWIIFKFLVDIPLKKIQDNKNDKQILQVIIYFMMAIIFFLMEITGNEVTVYTIIRGFIVVGACDIAIESLFRRKK